MEANEMVGGTLIVNQKTVEKKASVIIKNEVLFPLRTIFEELGAKVNWIENTGETEIVFNDKIYLCEIKAPNSFFPNNKYIYIKDVQNNCYFYLTPMSMGGSYEMINDRTYLHQETGKRLFEAMGCIVEIDLENQIVNISN